jgi:hypothetical protein
LVALIEQGDFAGATSANCLKIVHAACVIFSMLTSSC